MDHALRCNDMKCRAELREQAVVTTCSHVFCLDCSNRTDLNNAPPDQRTCPACQTRLSRPDDATLSNLNPSEDYKTSVLSGLSPDAVMECAGRALSFWSYQMTQDLCVALLESHRCKVLTNRYNELNATLDSIVNNANAQLTSLHSRIAGMALDQETLSRKNEELALAFKAKNRKLLQTQELYDKLKRKALLGHIQDAASDAVDTTLHGATTFETHSTDHNGPHMTYERQKPEVLYGTSRYDDTWNQPTAIPAPRMAPPVKQASSAWTNSGAPKVDVPATPSTHRQRLNGDAVGLSAVPGLVAGTPMTLQGPRQRRQSLRESQSNRYNHADGFNGLGLSSRLKTSQAPVSASAFVPVVRPRVVQRPPGFNFDPSPTNSQNLGANIYPTA